MVMSMFSVFDPVSKGLALGWVVLGGVLVLVLSSYYYKGGVCMIMWGWFKSSLLGAMSGTVVPMELGLGVLGGGMFLFLVVTNLLGLMPYVFCGSSHPFLTVGVGLLMWMVSFIMGWVKNFSFSVGHLTPEGSPLGLAPILVVIELVSHLIRPMTLSIRLAANMMAGHLILGLISSISVVGWGSFFISMLIQLVMMVLELGVCVIQGVVFSLLVMLYAVEYY